jgi:hypothetical protein
VFVVRGSRKKYGYKLMYKPRLNGIFMLILMLMLIFNIYILVLIFVIHFFLILKNYAARKIHRGHIPDLYPSAVPLHDDRPFYRTFVQYG